MDDREYMEYKVREATEEKIEKDIKKRKRQIQVRALKGFIIGSSVLLAGLGAYYLKGSDDDHLTYSEIKTEMYIHSGHAVGPDGKVVNPYLGHNCEVPYDGETSFTTRLSEAMAEEYSPEVIEETIALFDPMAYGDTEDFKEAKKELEEIEKSLKKGPDGKYDMKEKTKIY